MDVDASAEAKAQLIPQPIIIVWGKVNDPKDAYLATKGQLLCMLPFKKAPDVLLSVFHAFNM